MRLKHNMYENEKRSAVWDAPMDTHGDLPREDSLSSECGMVFSENIKNKHAYRPRCVSVGKISLTFLKLVRNPLMNNGGRSEAFERHVLEMQNARCGQRPKKLTPWYFHV